MLELLINAGSDINAQNIVGDAPLHKAALNGRALSADFLIRAGANVNIRNEFAQTPLHAACVSGNIEVVQRLVQGGADTNAQDAAEVRGAEGKRILRKCRRGGGGRRIASSRTLFRTYLRARIFSGLMKSVSSSREVLARGTALLLSRHSAGHPVVRWMGCGWFAAAFQGGGSLLRFRGSNCRSPSMGFGRLAEPPRADSLRRSL